MPSDSDIRAETKAQGLRIKRNNLLAAVLSGSVLVWFSILFFPHSIAGILFGLVLGFFYANGFEYCLHRFLLHAGRGFFCERAILQGGTLTLRQGNGWPADLGISVNFAFAHQGEELSGKTTEVEPERPPPVPLVVLRWKDDARKAANQKISGGYALKIAFGEAANGRIPGKIYICLPDDDKSFVAGTFEADIRKPPPPKRPPKNQKPDG